MSVFTSPVSAPIGVMDDATPPSHEYRSPGQVEVDVTRQLYRLEPDIAPMLQLCSVHAKKKATETPDYFHWEKDALNYRKVALTSATAGTSGTNNDVTYTTAAGAGAL